MHTFSALARASDGFQPSQDGTFRPSSDTLRRDAAAAELSRRADSSLDKLVLHAFSRSFLRLTDGPRVVLAGIGT
jgi:hypothetical protein